MGTCCLRNVDDCVGYSVITVGVCVAYRGYSPSPCSRSSWSFSSMKVGRSSGACTDRQDRNQVKQVCHVLKKYWHTF